MPIPLFDSTSDADLLRHIADGSAEAFVALFRRRRGDVYRFAVHLTGSPATAEDVTQDVFMIAMREARTFEPDRGTALAWLLGIARNHVRRRVMRDRWLRPLSDVTDPSDPAVSCDPLDDLERAARVEALRRALTTLPLRYREVVVLCDLQERSYADAAAVLRCAVGTIRSRLHRGRALLAAKLRKDNDGPRRPEVVLA